MPPSRRNSGDIFATVLESLRAADSGDMRDLSKSMLDNMTKIIGESISSSNQYFFAVIDEVQVAAEYINKHRDRWATRSASFLLDLRREIPYIRLDCLR